MIKTFGKVTLATLLVAMVVGVPPRASADDKATNKTANATSAPAKHRTAIPFRGKLSAVDKTAKTITVENKTVPKRTFEVTSETRIMKDNKPATLDDSVVGEDVHGLYAEGKDGKMTLKILGLGKSADKAATAPKKETAPAK